MSKPGKTQLFKFFDRNLSITNLLPKVYNFVNGRTYAAPQNPLPTQVRRHHK